MLNCIPTLNEQVKKLILWDVGQGQWATLISSDYCHHFDMGGEKAPWEKIIQYCGLKKNIVSFSHWDIDHINLTKKFSYKVYSLCILDLPGGQFHHWRNKKFLSRVPRCTEASNNYKEVLFSKSTLSTNASSKVYSVEQQILIPGDSTKKDETRWAKKLKQKIYYLVLGHHGSLTSTSTLLLKSLPHLKQSLASNRKSRYGHPHKIVEQRLSKMGIPHINTQEWGNIIINLGY